MPIWCCSGWRLPRFTLLRRARGDPDAQHGDAVPVRIEIRPRRRLVSVALFLGFAHHACARCDRRTVVSRHPAIWSPDLPRRLRAAIA